MTTSREIPALSLFCFADVARDNFADKYEQLLSTARLADTLNFHAIWTPERHFHTFGGMFANPSVVSAALAACTQRIGIRAGSVVLPLHDPLRVAEEWAIVDNLSHGRAGVAFASGWQRNDFVLRAENYRQRQQVLFPHWRRFRRCGAVNPSHATSFRCLRNPNRSA